MLRVVNVEEVPEWVAKEDSETEAMDSYNPIEYLTDVALPLGATQNKDSLALVHGHPRDNLICFRDWNPITNEKDHTYWTLRPEGIWDPTRLLSATKIFSTAFDPFDADAIIDRMMNGRTWGTTRSKYYGMNREQIKEQWSTAGPLGTRLHAAIEDHINGRPINPEVVATKEWNHYLEFRKDHPIISYRTEWFVHSLPNTRNDIDLRICGAIDFVVVDYVDKINDTIVLKLIDWKRSTRVTGYPGFADECGWPLHGINQTKRAKYSAQLTGYVYMLENGYFDVVYEGEIYHKIKVSIVMLVVLHPENKSYQLRVCPVYRYAFDSFWIKRVMDLYWTEEMKTIVREYVGEPGQISG